MLNTIALIFIGFSMISSLRIGIILFILGDMLMAITHLKMRTL